LLSASLTTAAGIIRRGGPVAGGHDSVKPLPQSAAYLGVVLASGLGSASLLLLVAFLLLGSFHFLRFDLSPAAALAWNAMLSAAFFLQHSSMVRRSFRQRLERFIAEPIHGLVYTMASGSVLILCLVLWQRTGEPIVLLEGPLRWSLRALFLLAIAGFAWGIRALGSFDTFGVRPLMAHLRGIQPPHVPFVVRGPYRWVRHPLYFFALVLFWSCPVITPDRLLFNCLWTAWVVLATVLEERDLVFHFGEPYVRYQREVPMILPWRMPTRGSSGLL
jgi:protein-S-isoprenylcysteine O-methyltransferase Ste14